MWVWGGGGGEKGGGGERERKGRVGGGGGEGEGFVSMGIWCGVICEELTYNSREGSCLVSCVCHHVYKERKEKKEGKGREGGNGGGRKGGQRVECRSESARSFDVGHSSL